ncbi:acetoin reductase family protein [Vararia minispora EC-137]|uniref:Acetoin reductase family protein n=1 Tax=Vararia minispora EC-137 TaxID=1314806 RepID=A0ACB8QDT8_9AGAM|nr:acetoin reductase family protein [Vararia minispora EC-137]
MASTPPPRRVALVTGAARGIGRGIALRLAADGLDVALNDLPSSAPELADVARAIERAGRRAVAVPADVSCEPDVARMIADAVAALGALDVMVANAGIACPGGVLETSLDDFERVQATNVRGTFLCYKYAARQMVAQGRGGRIIGACSRAGKQAQAHVFAYSTSKFAVRGMTQAAAGELAKHRITVNAYAPGTIETDLLQSIRATPSGGAYDAPNSPLGRYGTPADVAALVSYLSSSDASFITGTHTSTPFRLRALTDFEKKKNAGQTVSVNGGIYFD